MNIGEFAQFIRAHDGVDAFNEASRLALAADRPARVRHVIEEDGQIVALAYAAGDAPVDMAVHPDHRRRGHGTVLADRLLRQGEQRFWAHGDLPAARGWAALLGLERERTLLRLALRESQPSADVPPPDDVVLRPFQEADVAGLLDVNARAFATHSEQGTMDRDDFDLRRGSDWFDPAGLFVAEHRGDIVGFHWTKVDQRVGEVYVLAVDPDRHDTGVGAALLAHGLAHLSSAHVDTIELYVDEDNSRALDVYAVAGFAEVSRDVLYVSTTPEATARGRS